MFNTSISIIAKNVHIYRWFDGKLRSYTGDVYRNGRSRGRCYDNSAEGVQYRLGVNCSLNPGEVFNNVVWLYDDNPALALGFLMNYEDDQIAYHQNRLECHQAKRNQMRQLSTSKITIVYDCDDVLLALNDEVFLQLNLPRPKHYRIREDSQYTPDQQDVIMNAYGDPSNFATANFYPGADQILDVESSGRAIVWICTRSFNEDIVKIKKARLPAVTGISLDHVDFQIGMGFEKKSLSFADIVVEDCRENLLTLPDGCYRILIDASYNQASEEEDYRDKIIRCDSLLQANRVVQNIVDTWTFD